jgi:hypothetical protein
MDSTAGQGEKYPEYLARKIKEHGEDTHAASA